MAGTTKAQIKAYNASKGTSTSKTSSSGSTAQRLAQVSAQAKSLGIDTSKADSMLAQTKAQGSTPYKGSSFEKTYLASTPINSTTVAQNPDVIVPEKPKPQDVGNKITADNTGLLSLLPGYTVDEKGQFVAPKDVQGTSQDYSGLLNIFQSKMVDNRQAPPSQVDIYNKLPEKKAYENAQKDVNNYTAQINTIAANRDAQIIALEGQGRGQTTGFIGGEQARINREAAINALPIQAQLAAAQGNLELAQSHLETMFALKSADAKAQYEYKNKLFDSVANFLTGVEEKRLTALKTQEDRKYTETQDFYKTQQSLLSSILAQNGPSSVYNAVKSATTKEDAIIAAGAYNGDVLARQIQQQQLVKAKNDNAMTSVGFNGPYTGILNTILGSGKFTKDQSSSIVRAINSGEDPMTVIRNNAKQLLGQTEATTVTKYEAAQSVLKDIQTNLATYYAMGGNTNIFSGNMEKVINKLGTVNDPALVDIATQIQASLQVYRNAVSGTAYSVQEGADIASIFPGINKSEGLNTAIINGRMKAFDSTIDGTYRAVLGSQYDALKKSTEPAPVTDPKQVYSEVVQNQSIMPTQTTDQTTSTNGFARFWNSITSFAGF